MNSLRFVIKNVTVKSRIQNFAMLMSVVQQAKIVKYILLFLLVMGGTPDFNVSLQAISLRKIKILSLYHFMTGSFAVEGKISQA